MAMVHTLPRLCILVLHCCMVVSEIISSSRFSWILICSYFFSQAAGCDANMRMVRVAKGQGKHEGKCCIRNVYGIQLQVYDEHTNYPNKLIWYRLHDLVVDELQSNRDVAD